MISIIIPTLNEERCLEATLKNLREHFFAIPYEIIVSDGRSADRTVAIARAYADTVMVYAGQKRQTIGQARNDGARAAQGEILVFIDADVMIPDPDNFFTRVLELFARRKNLAALCPTLAISPVDRTWSDRFFLFFINAINRLLNNQLRCGCAPGECQIVRADRWRAIGGYQEHLVAAEDNDFFWRLARVGETWMEPTIKIFHSGRRAHAIGWPRLLALWLINGVWVTLRKKSVSKVWTPIR